MTIRGLQLLMVCVILAATVPAHGSSEVAPPARATMEFRIAASLTEDAAVAKLAKTSTEKNVYEGNQHIAKWVLVLESKAAELQGIPSLVTRTNDRGKVELLVLVGPNDLTEKHVTGLTSSIDYNGRRAILVQFGEEDSRRLQMLTAENLGRHLAEIVDGYVYGAPKIQTTIYDRAMITGEFTEEMIANLAERLDADWVGEIDQNRRIFLTLWHLIAAAAVLIVIVLAALRAPQLHVRRIWFISGAFVAAIIGGYWLGVTTSYGTAPIAGGFHAIQITRHVSLLHVLAGVALGTIVGSFGGYLLRRAIHNATRLLTAGGRGKDC